MARETTVVSDIMEELVGDIDPLRSTRPFAPEMEAVHEVLWAPHNDDWARERMIFNWLQAHQPCLFGAIAARQDMLHVCILHESDLYRTDAHIQRKIRNAVMKWKRRNLTPRKGVSHPAPGFLLVLSSRTIAEAAPGPKLHALAQRIRHLWGCACQKRRDEADLIWETLYLKHPTRRLYYRFRFTVDFFMAQGDGRWWQDHRFPGGMAFTANSVGHMRKYRELYGKSKKQKAWSLQTAMVTIASAQDTEYGRATWLMNAHAGQPWRGGAPRISAVALDKESLRGADRTSYQGRLHTDHCIRPEFFRVDPDVPTSLKREPWIEDFSYLYDPGNNDHLRFVEGEVVNESEVIRKLGPRDTWPSLIGDSRRVLKKAALAKPSRSQEQQIGSAGGDEGWQAALREGESWRISAWEIKQLDRVVGGILADDQSERPSRAGPMT